MGPVPEDGGDDVETDTEAVGQAAAKKKKGHRDVEDRASRLPKKAYAKELRGA
jgi:hypothetical protein